MDYDTWLSRPLLPSLFIHEAQEDQRFTGVLGPDGDKVYRQHLPIGFGRMKEWRQNNYLLLKS